MSPIKSNERYLSEKETMNERDFEKCWKKKKTI